MKEQGRMTEAQVIEQDKNKASLELLIGDRKSSKNFMNNNVSDSRFNTTDGAFAVDPTHREYKKVVQGHNKVVKRPSHQHKHR